MQGIPCARFGWSDSAQPRLPQSCLNPATTPIVRESCMGRCRVSKCMRMHEMNDGRTNSAAVASFFFRAGSFFFFHTQKKA